MWEKTRTGKMLLSKFRTSCRHIESFSTYLNTPIPERMHNFRTEYTVVYRMILETRMKIFCYLFRNETLI